MACALNKEQISDVYKLIYFKLQKSNDIINVDDFIKFFYDLALKSSEDTAKALLYAQAVPDIFTLVTNQKAVKSKLVKNNFDFNSIYNRSVEFEELKNVKSFFAPKKVSIKEQKQKIIQKNIKSQDVIIEDPKSESKISNVEKKSKVDNPLTNTINYSKTKSPNDDEQDVQDPEKKMFALVIKNIITLNKNKPADQNEIIYDNVSLAQRPFLVNNFPTKSDGTSFLVSDDVEFLRKNPEYNGIMNVITDIEGNLIYFTEDGKITNDPDEGRLVYQAIRDVVLDEGKLALTNRSGYKYSLVDPVDIVDAENNLYKKTVPFGMSKDAIKKKISNVKRIQKDKLNRLYTLHEYIKNNPEEVVVLKITGGSYGFSPRTFVPISETNITFDQINQPYIAGKKRGIIEMQLTENIGDNEINHTIRLQRGDINKELADKIADILTTKLKYRGDELTPAQRRKYAEIFLGDNVKIYNTDQIKNNIEIDTPSINGVTTLVVKIKGENVDLSLPNAKDLISKHLLNAVEVGTNVYPANLNFSMNNIMEENFSDYVIKDNKIVAVSKNYFEFIYPFIKIEFSPESGAYFLNGNSYLSFLVPTEITPAGSSSKYNIFTNQVQAKTKKAKEKNDIDDATNIVVEPGDVIYNIKKLSSAFQIKENINNSDITFNIGVDFITGDAKIAKATNKKEYIALALSGKNRKSNTVPNLNSVVNNLVKQLNRFKKDKINITGNNIVELFKKGFSQSDIDKYMYSILEGIVNSPDLEGTISQIVTTGETGVSEAFIKAARKLGIGVEVTVPSGWKFTKIYKAGRNGQWVVSDKNEFKERFGDAVAETKSKTKKPFTKTSFTKTSFAKKTTKKVYAKKSGQTQKQNDSKLNGKPSDDLANRLRNLFNNNNKPLTRVINYERGITGLFEKLFTTKAQRDSIYEWWEKSFLSQAKKQNGDSFIPLDTVEKLSEVINSNAFATWSQHGITLNLANNATPIDLYHEAWHGFSQLFLTLDEKTRLYEEMRKIPKWSELDYLDIEEIIAEDFRSFMKDETLYTGFIGKIFKKIKEFLRVMFGKITQQDMIRPRDIANIKNYFDQLYKGEILDLKPSMDNIMFSKLNRLKTINNNFTIDESDKINNTIDNFIGLEIAEYNANEESSTGVIRLFSDPVLQESTFNSIKDRIQLQLEYLTSLVDSVEDDKTESLIKNENIFNNIVLLNKALENFGDISKTLNGKEKDNVLAYNIKKSRFKIIQEVLLEDPDDLENTRILQDYKGNVINPKNLAAPSTLMLLSNINQIQKTEDGAIIEVLDDFGTPQLEDLNIIWNKLSKITEGSFDYEDMYNRIAYASDNYPEFIQLLDLLRPPSQLKLNDKLQFSLETNFFKDLKKPRVKYIQFNINKNITQRRKYDEEGRTTQDEIASYDTLVVDASLAIYPVINDWKSNFISASVEVNPYIEVDEDGVNFLNTDKIIKTFSDRNGVFKTEKSRDFLKVFGIEMDNTSPELNSLFNNSLAIRQQFKLDLILENVKIVHNAGLSTDISKIAASQKFKKNPLEYLQKGLPKELVPINAKKNDVNSSIKLLAELQVQWSDGFSNFSVLSPDGNRLWEQIVDNTITRVITSINSANSFQELTRQEADPNGKYKHMRWLANENNPHSKYSQLLNSIFYLDDIEADNYGLKRKVKKGSEFVDVKLTLNNVAGTQLIDTEKNEYTGEVTAALDGTSKFLQELHTMLLSGVEEFMRHASKQTAMSLSSQKIESYPNKSDDHLYIDIESFKPKNSGEGETEGFYIMLGYLAGELERINRFNDNIDTMSNWAGYSREVEKQDGSVVMAGSVFTAFDDVLTEETKEKLYKIKENLIEYLEREENYDLKKEIKKDILNYFNKETALNLNKLESTRFIDQTLYEKGFEQGLNKLQVDEVLIKAYTYNSWIHKYETIILAYGDLVQYNHDKEEFHKRNAGLASGGLGFRSDIQAQFYINDKSFFPRLYANKENYKIKNYDGTLKTAVIKEKEIKESVYYKEYLKELTESIKNRLGDNVNAAEIAKKTLSEYLGMKEGDGQGHISLESYRMLKELEGNWSDNQELLYKKIVNGDSLSVEDVIQYFPPYKLQYFGNIKTEILPITSFHKFSLAPLIPNLSSENGYQDMLHDAMMKQGIDYVLFESGSKVSHIGKGDVVINEDGSFNEDVIFTENTIFAEYLKNQTEINSSYKKSSIFSTQLRAIILEGLYEKGIIDTTNEDKITNPAVKKYLNDVNDYTETLKLDLLNEIGFEENNGNYSPKSSDSLEKLANLIRDNLEIDDVIGDHLIDFIDVLDSGQLKFDLSLHPEAAKIEKLIMSIINKRVIKQQINGEPLVQVSAAFYTNTFKKPKLRLGSDEDIKKYVGSNFLPTYHKQKDGKTAAMKIMIAIQGDYENLLNLNDLEGNKIETLDKLNELIKNDEWLNLNDGQNRKTVTIVGVRIPVQGLNSMEFMEVYHFLPAQAGNIIIPPSEIVAKSGADFDIDKLTLYMANLNADGTLPEQMFTSDNDSKSFNKLKEYLADPTVSQEDKAFALNMQKKSLQNNLIDSVRGILELPQNYISLITPNGTYLLKDIADDLSQYVMDYNPYTNRSSDKLNKSVKQKNKDGSKKSSISPTRVFEALYNIYKHESNVVGKRTLGLGAIENKFHTIINSIETNGGAAMPDTFLHNEKERKSMLWLRHNKVFKDGVKLISISNKYDVDKKIKISDVFSQMMNGWVDVEKDAWIFFIQGNYEVAPLLLYLIKTGVPVKEAIYFVSQPLVREYVKEQNLGKSTYADVLGKSPGDPNLIKFNSASNVIKKYFGPETAESLSTNERRYNKGIKLANAVFENRNDKYFTEKEMYKFIKDSKTNPEVMKTEFSLAMFLHFLQIEQQITALTELKMASNPDTSLKVSGSEVEETEANLELLEFNSKLEPDLVNAMQKSSIISSFFMGKLSIAINSLIFPLRYNDAVSSYLITKNSQIRKDTLKTFGKNNTTAFKNSFRNAMISFLFQNAARKYKLSDTYKSYTLNKTIPVSLVDELKFGAFVKEDKKGNKVLYVDEKAIKDDFTRNVFDINSQQKDSYFKRGLYPLSISHFRLDKKSNEGEYIKFVAEREYLRSIYSMSDIKKLYSFNSELKTIKEMYPQFSGTKAERFTYEKFITNKALENTLNPYHMFSDPKEAFAVKFNNIINKYKTELQGNYAIINKIKNEPNAAKTMFNLYVAEKDFTNDISNLYHKNLLDLSNPGIKKVDNDAENIMISDFFSKLPFYAFMQTGINKTKFNFTNIVQYNDFINLVNDESKKLINALEDNTLANKFLDMLYSRFIRENNRSKTDKGRFQNYLLDFNLDDLSSMKKETITNIELSTDVKPKGTINVYWGQAESATSTKILSNLAPREFIYQSKEYGSVEHAYQSLKSGSFDQVTYDKYIKVGGYGTKIRGKAVTQGFDNLQLIKDLVIESFKQNSNSEAAKKLLQYENFTHNTNEIIDKAFLEGLKLAQQSLLSTQSFISVEEDLDVVKTNERYGLMETKNPNVFIMDDINFNPTNYNNVLSKNTDVTFVYPTSIAILQNKAQATGKSVIKNIASEMSIGLPVAQNNMTDNMKDLPSDFYNNIINYYNEQFELINTLVKDGLPVAFLSTGYGSVTEMPKELFIHLSKELYQQPIGFLNPGSTMYKDLQKLVKNRQGISDQEILDNFGLEEDPFTCKI